MTSLTPDFEALYRTDADPWRADSAYEQHKLAVVAATLSRPTYGLVWDLACGTGHLARLLAERCTRLLASDLAASAVALTARRCAGCDNVTVRRSALPHPPDEESTDTESPDLILLSEVFYYLDDQTRRDTLAMIEQRAAPGCELLAVHWSGAPHDAWLSGPAAQCEIGTRLTGSDWHHRSQHHEQVPAGEDAAPGFTLDGFIRRPA